MPATKKIVRQSQDQDLAQMKNLFSNSASILETKAEEPEVTELISDQKSSTASAQPDSKVISDTKIGIRLTTDKKNELKAYFISHGVTVSQGVLDAYELLKRFESEGKVAYKNGILNVF